INVNGDMNLCCIHDTQYKKRYIVGNIYKERFEDIWNGRKMNNFRKQLTLGDVPAMCKDCDLL
ncbi:SPASM domain-containing protein, partial [Chloroflexota bacterium]